MITKSDPDLSRTESGLNVREFHPLVQRRVFRAEQVNQPASAFRRYEDALLDSERIENPKGCSTTVLMTLW